jgi:nucleoside-diphosphate-sugar epimerase
MMIIDSFRKKMYELYNDRPLILEGANGSLGLSFAEVFFNEKIIPSTILLTTYSSDIHPIWHKIRSDLVHIKTIEDPDFFKRNNIIKGSFGNSGINIIFASGYGQPNKFLNDPISIIHANILTLLKYSEYKNIESFAYMSTSEIYAGVDSDIDENSFTKSKPQNSRGVYIESKRLAEAIVSNILSKKIKRTASFRVALAFPPRCIEGDTRVLADLISSGKKGIVTLNRGAEFIRQYQYGPNAAIKILSAIANGKSSLYNNSGSHIISLGDLAKLISKILNVDMNIKNNLTDNTAPTSVIINHDLIDSESGYLKEDEKTLEEYLMQAIQSE